MIIRCVGSCGRKKLFFIITLIGLVLYVFNNFFTENSAISVQHSQTHHAKLLKPSNFICQSNVKNPYESNTNYTRTTSHETLIFTSNKYKDLHNSIVKVFDSLRFKHKLLYLNERFNLDHYLNTNQWYGLVIFESYEDYTKLNAEQRGRVDSYCMQYGIGIIFFTKTQQTNKVYLQECELGLTDDETQTFFYVTKPNNVKIQINKFVEYFSVPDSDTTSTNILTCDNTVSIISISKSTDFRKVYIGLDPNEIWILKLLFIDSIVYASNGRLRVDLLRFIQIDIDDMFVGLNGTRLKENDVYALVRLQYYLAKKYFQNSYVTNKTTEYTFRFNLGFSGYYYKSGLDAENKADELLIVFRNEFNWFEHSWSHLKPHLLNRTMLRDHMLMNLNFAQTNNLPVDSFYSVSPHHSGIYPVYDELYEKWSSVWKVKASSTNMYPHGRPVHLNRGFIHKGIMVAPRHSCGVYTHTLHFDAYPNGVDALIAAYKGGEVFDTVIYNDVVIFMTHMANYANDRLANYIISNLFEFLNCWTNFRFKSLPPYDLVNKYFEVYPEDKEPLWTNPCDDAKHLLTWSKNSADCLKTPKFIIIGPQRSGTTALYTFLKVNKRIQSNRNTSDFEETQFFTDKYYNKGINWYLDLFDSPSSNDTIFFEKSANYFNDANAPRRIKAFNKNMKLIAILINPVQRAYSWYQHMKSHKDPVALNYTFFDIINSNKSQIDLYNLRLKCLHPGHYYQHLKKWFDFFTPNDLYLVDGDLFIKAPYVYLNKLQDFLQIPKPHLDYKKILRFNGKKKFYCYLNDNGHHKCLGESKGRVYDEIDAESYRLLSEYYLELNKKLLKLLKFYRYRVPTWLKQDLGNHSHNVL